MTGQTHVADGGWMETYTGRRVVLQAPTPDMIDIEDIAHALSIINRYTGHTRFPYSVAQHSVLMTKWGVDKMDLLPGEALAVLMHDAQEAYIGDIASPLKHLLPDYKEMEQEFEKVIQTKYGLPPDKYTKLIVSNLDVRILAKERQELMPHTGKYEWFLPDWATPLTVDIDRWSAEFAKTEFLDLFGILQDDLTK